MARNFVFLLSLGRVATVGTIGRRPGARSRDHRLELSPDEVTTSDGVAQASGAGVFRSLFYLAVVSRALDEVHVALDCAKCHKSYETAAGPLVRYRPLGTTCGDCHTLGAKPTGGR